MTKAALRVFVSLATLSLLLIAAESLALAERNRVVVLPMTSSAKSLRIFQRATSTALARGLERAGRFNISVSASAKEVPSDAAVVIDGRLVTAEGGRVMLEARVRRAVTGQAVGTRATRFADTTDIDALVSALVGKLSPLVRAALRPAGPIRLPTAVVQGAAVQGAALERASGRSQAAPQAPPVVLVIPASGSAAKGVIAVREPATAGALGMLSRLGLRVATSSGQAGIADPVAAASESKRRGARFALMLHVRKVRFSYNTVLSARGSVRVMIVGNDGLAVLDETVQTDTLVGSRGDRHQALVYRVAEQAMDILLPKIRRAIDA